MTETEDFLELLTDPIGHGVKKAVAALKEGHIQITEINLTFEFDEFRQLDIWTVNIVGTNVGMFQKLS